MKNKSQNEGMFDRLSAGWTGIKTGVSNINATAAGTPAKVTSVQDAKIKQLFTLAQSRMKPFVKNINSKNIISRTNAEIAVKKELLGFLQDFMKMTGEKNPNNIIATLQQPQYKDISTYLTKIGISVPVSTSVSKPKSTPTSTPKSKPTSTPKSTPTSSAPKSKTLAHGAKFAGKTYDSTVGAWIIDSTGNKLNSSASSATTNAYLKTIPENINKITYKEFFV